MGFGIWSVHLSSQSLRQLNVALIQPRFNDKDDKINKLEGQNASAIATTDAIATATTRAKDAIARAKETEEAAAKEAEEAAATAALSRGLPTAKEAEEAAATAAATPTLIEKCAELQASTPGQCTNERSCYPYPERNPDPDPDPDPDQVSSHLVLMSNFMVSALSMSVERKHLKLAHRCVKGRLRS